MTMISYTMIFSVAGQHDLEAHTDAVADALIDLEDCTAGLLDSTVTTDLEAERVEITVTVKADDLDTGNSLANSSIRAAIHTAGGATPTWGEPMRAINQSSELVSA